MDKLAEIAIGSARRAYATCHAEREQLRAEVAELRSTLAFYATATLENFDNGYRATKALKAK